MRPPISQESSGVLTHGSKYIRLVAIQSETRRRDTNNRVTLIIEDERQTESVRIVGEAALPETVAQNDHRCCSRLVLFGQEGAPSVDWNTEYAQAMGWVLSTI